MSRIRGILTCRRVRLKRTFCYLIIVTLLMFICLSWWTYFVTHEEDEERIGEISMRRVQSDYSYYYNIDVEGLKGEFSSFEGLKENDKDSLEDHYFNKILSDDFPLDRNIPDSRDPQCSALKYRISKEEHESVSIIISYHNEALSALLRTIISILNRTPPDLLKEILLIDDSSEKDYQQILLRLPKVRYLKNNLRLGLIKSRNRAADEALGTYFLFMDSHCEVNQGWLEPLLERLAMNRGLLVSPIVDIIDPQDFSYKSSTLKLKAGFDWSLRFKWIPRTEVEIEGYKNDPKRPFYSPMTFGGVFMVHRDWFNELGKFDDELEIWGGESVEMSIKAWLCGGQIEIIPCSRMGHIFRKKHPYTFPTDNVALTMLRNSKRIAENWLDEYKKFYYMERPQAMEMEIALDRNITDVIKDRLQCRSFAWYLRVIFPELKIPNEQNLAYGELKSDNKCLQISIVGQIEVSDCYQDDHVTTWSLHNNTNLLTATSGGCLTAYSDFETVGLEFCKTGREYPAQKWRRNRGNLINVQTKRCLENLGRSIGMSRCRIGANTQLWHFSVEIEQRT